MKRGPRLDFTSKSHRPDERFSVSWGAGTISNDHEAVRIDCRDRTCPLSEVGHYPFHRSMLCTAPAFPRLCFGEDRITHMPNEKVIESGLPMEKGWIWASAYLVNVSSTFLV